MNRAIHEKLLPTFRMHGSRLVIEEVEFLCMKLLVAGSVESIVKGERWGWKVY